MTGLSLTVTLPRRFPFGTSPAQPETSRRASGQANAANRRVAWCAKAINVRIHRAERESRPPPFRKGKDDGGAYQKSLVSTTSPPLRVARAGIIALAE